MIYLKKILIIEDDTNINDMLRQLVISYGYEPVSAYSGTEGVLLHNATISIILLDLMLPGKNGEEIIEELKAKQNVPIIVMSAIHELDKKLELFRRGADDYITKPFSNEELMARIQIQLKHFENHNPSSILKYKDIEMNRNSFTVICNKKKMSLTKNEFELLRVFMENPNQVITKSTLFDRVWGDEDSADDNTLNVHISKIRNKLKENNPNEEYIETVWSIGYRFKK